MFTKKLGPGVLAALAVAALGVAPAGALATPKKPPTKIKCAPGALTIDAAGNVTHVCDKNGNWVKVLRMTAAPQNTRGTAGTVLEARS